MKKQKINKNEICREFELLYEKLKDSFMIGSKFLSRLNDNHYSKHTYNNLIGIMKWFAEHYDPEKYIGRISMVKKRYYFLVRDKDIDQEFVCYLWSKGKMYNSQHDTKIYYNYFKSNYPFNENKQYIVDVPDYY
jgi:hypothetical protein